MPQKTEEQRINDLEKHQAVLDVKVDNILTSINEIKVNHLVHINDQLVDIYKKLSDLSLVDAKNEPSNRLLNKVIEYVILGVIGIGIAWIASK